MFDLILDLMKTVFATFFNDSVWATIVLSPLGRKHSTIEAPRITLALRWGKPRVKLSGPFEAWPSDPNYGLTVFCILHLTTSQVFLIFAPFRSRANTSISSLQGC
jgi:hypothetical protein